MDLKSDHTSMFKDVQPSATTASYGPAADDADEGIRILRLPAVLRRVGLSRSSIYSRIRRGTFPRSVRLGDHAIGFVEHEISSWIKSAIEHRSPQ